MASRSETPLRSTLFWGAFRVIFVTVMVTLLAFATSMFLSIAGVLLVSMFRVGAVDMAYTYRNIALPIAMVALAVTFVFVLGLEVRNFRRSRG